MRNYRKVGAFCLERWRNVRRVPDTSLEIWSFHQSTKLRNISTQIQGFYENRLTVWLRDVIAGAPKPRHQYVFFFRPHLFRLRKVDKSNEWGKLETSMLLIIIKRNLHTSIVTIKSWSTLSSDWRIVDCKVTCNWGRLVSSTTDWSAVMEPLWRQQQIIDNQSSSSIVEKDGSKCFKTYRTAARTHPVVANDTWCIAAGFTAKGARPPAVQGITGAIVTKFTARQSRFQQISCVKFVESFKFENEKSLLSNWLLKLLEDPVGSSSAWWWKSLRLISLPSLASGKRSPVGPSNTKRVNLI